MESTYPVKEESDSSPVSHFVKTVYLDEWWLTKVDDGDTKRLGVAGLTSKDQARRSFSSAAIRRACDIFTLETVDEMTVRLRGFIKKPETKKNGFSPEVFKHFVIGFSPDWEKCVEKFLEGGSSEEDISKDTISPEKSVIDSGGSDHKDTDLSEATKQSAKTSRKRKSRTSARDSDVNQCLNEIGVGTPDCNKKTITNSRLKTCDTSDSNQAGLYLSKKQNLISKSKVQNCDKKISSQAGKDDKNAKKVLEKCTSSSSKKKTKRKLTYGKSDATQGDTNGAFSASPQLSSLKKSRSGRKLLPTLEFWRNQTAVYDQDRELTSIKCRSSDGLRC